MVDVHRLVGDLETRTSHTEMHAVHVNLTGEWLIFCGLRQVRVFVSVEGH